MQILIIYSCALIIYIKWIYMIIYINFIQEINFSWNQYIYIYIYINIKAGTSCGKAWSSAKFYA